MSRKSEFNLSWLVLIPMADRNSNTIGEQPTCHSRTECARLVAQNGNPVHCYWHVAPGSPRSRLLQKCKFKDIVCSCHSERSEESPVLSGGSFGRFATQDDMQNTDFEFCNTLLRGNDRI